VDAERQIGEVAQVREHPVDVVGRDAAEQQGAHAELLEPAHRAPEGVALRAAPVLAVDAAQAVAAAPEGQPHGQADGRQRLDRRVQRGADDGEALDDEEVRRLVGQGAAQQPDRLGPVGAVDVGVDREGDRHLALAPLLGHRLAHEPDAPPRELGPARVPAAGGRRREQPLGVGGDDVAAGADVVPVQGERVG
jgi:hypothetical protein